jgi:hypothetical protein
MAEAADKRGPGLMRMVHERVEGSGTAMNAQVRLECELPRGRRCLPFPLRSTFISAYTPSKSLLCRAHQLRCHPTRGPRASTRPAPQREYVYVARCILANGAAFTLDACATPLHASRRQPSVCTPPRGAPRRCTLASASFCTLRAPCTRRNTLPLSTRACHAAHYIQLCTYTLVPSTREKCDACTHLLFISG